MSSIINKAQEVKEMRRTTLSWHLLFSLLKKAVGLERSIYKNRKRQKVFFAPLLLFFISLFYLPLAEGQVQYKVDLLSDGLTYQVSMLPSVTWASPQNITSTAQVSIKIPSGGFMVNNVTSLIPGTFWSNNAQYSSPPESPNYDYVSFGLTSLGTDNFTYESGVEQPLFTFTNSGTCTGPVELITDDDPFYPPNSLSANITNQITTIGSGLNTNAFSGTYGVGSANCLSDLGCLSQYEVDQLADGTYLVSMIMDTAWNTPNNITEELMVTLVAPTGSMGIGQFYSVQSGAGFSHTNTYGFQGNDYFVFELSDVGTSALHYQRDLSVPLFGFANIGDCGGDSLYVMDNATDPFAMPNIQNVPVGQFLRTVGSGTTLEPCPFGGKQALNPVINSVTRENLLDCNANNGGISIDALSDVDLEYSIDSGATWQASPAFVLLDTGAYHIMVRFPDAQCEIEYDQNPVILSQPDAPQINTIVADNPSGCGTGDGSITIATAGLDSKEYSIDNGVNWQVSNTFVGLSEGTYPVMVRNGNLTCPIFGDTILLAFDDPTSPTIDTVISSDLTSCSAINGIIQIKILDTVAIEYSIDNGTNWSPNPNFTDLAKGDYFIQVRNAATGCVSVYDNNPIKLNTPDCDNCTAEYELELLANGKYLISVIPHETWVFPQNVTSTAQVTIVVPTGSFEVMDLTNLIPGVVFNNNSIIVAPPENPSADYISFGLESLGTTNIPYVDGQKVPLFTFVNSNDCRGSQISLMSNETDPFAFPNSQAINVGQQLTTIGSGQDGFVCIKEPSFVPCFPNVDAISDTIYVFVGTTVFYNILDNDSSLDGHPLFAEVYPGSMADNGTFNLLSDGTVSYSPDPMFTGMDTLRYVVCENATPSTCNTASIVFIVSAGNALVAADDGFQTLVNTALDETVGSNDQNPYNNNLTFTLASNPSNGSVTMNADGTFSYMPNIGFVGFDEFVYKVCDDGFPVVCDYANVQIQVTGSTDLLAVNDSYLGAMGTTLTADVSLNDFNPNGGLLTVFLLPGSNVQNGSVMMNTSGSFDYTPNVGFAGIDGFEYVICETTGSMLCDTASVAINIQADISALDDAYDLDVNTSAMGNAISNDLYPMGIGVNASLLQGPLNGSLDFDPDGQFTYTPAIGFVGGDVFTYYLCSTNIPVVCDTATVRLNIVSDLDAMDDAFMAIANAPIDEDVLPNDVFATGIDVTAALITPTNDGSLNFNPDGTFTYVPNVGFLGTDSFVYQLCDDGIPQTCDTATVDLTIVSDIMAIDDVFDIPTNGGILMDNVAGNDFVPNGNSYTTNVVDPTDNGMLILFSNGDFNYDPNPGFIGVDSFLYQLCDDNIPPNCDTATVVIAVFENIVAEDDSFNLNINMVLMENILPNDTFIDLNNLTINVLEPTDNGNLIVDPDGSFTYAPDFNFLGLDQFVYSICGVGGAACDTAIVSLLVTTELLAIDDIEQVPAGVPFSGDVKDNDIFGPNIDPTDFTVGILPGTGPQNGTISLNPDGSYTYFPNNGFIGNDGFTYVICNNDQPPLCDTAMVTFMVLPTSILAVNDTFNVFSYAPLVDNILLNDFTPAGSTATLSTTPVVPPSVGLLTLYPNGSFFYASSVSFTGLVTFQYEICNDLVPSQCDTATVFINALSAEPPGIICPSGQVCENENIVLTIGQAYPNGVEYEWQNGNGDVVGTDASLILAADSPLAIEPFRARVTLNGLSTDFGSACYVDVIEMPDVYATSAGDVCVGGGTQLFATGIAGATYEWRELGNTTVFSASQNPFITNLTSNTLYELTVKLNQCGLYRKDTVDVAVVAPPTLNVQADYFMQANCSPSDLQLEANAVGTNLFYSWTGPNGFSSNLESPVISNTNANANGYYSVTVTNATGCSSVGGYSMNGILDFIPEPIITTTTPVCTGVGIELLTQYYAGGSVDYEWMHEGSAMIGNSSNQLILPEVEMTDNGYYQVRVEVDQCVTVSDSFYVEILESPYADPTVEQNDPCGDEPILFFANASNFGSIATYQWIGPNGFSSTATDPVISYPDSEHAGTYNLEVTAENGCMYSADVSVDSAFAAPLPPNLEVTDNAPCLGETLELQALGSYTGQSVKYHWYFDNGIVNNAMAITSAPSFFIPSVSTTNEGTYSVQVVVNGCISNVSNLTNVTILGAGSMPAENSTTANPACEGGTVFLTTTIIPGANYQWYGPSGFSSTNAQPVLQDVSSANAGGYYAIIEKDGCFVHSDTTQVAITDQPSVPLLLAEDAVCESDSLVLFVANPVFGNNVAYEFFYSASGLQIDSTNNSYTTVYNINTNQAGSYYAVAYVDGCPSGASTSVDVSVQQVPQNVAYAGDDEIHCEILTSIALDALAPTVGSGVWSSPTGAIIPNFDNAQTQATNLQVGQNIFVWTLSYGACEDYSVDTLTISMNELPNEAAFAGTDITICNQDTVWLNAASVSIASGQWSQNAVQTASGAVIAQPDSAETAVTGLLPGEQYHFTWSLSEGFCENFSTDGVTVNVVEAPLNQEAIILTEANGLGNDTLVLCGDLTTVLEGNAPDFGTGSWTTTGGAAITNPSSSITGIQELGLGMETFVWTLSYGVCESYSSDTIHVMNEDIETNNDLFVSMVGDTTLQPLDILFNDFITSVSDWDINIVNPPLKGMLTLDENGIPHYVALPNVGGTDEFTYMICSKSCPLVCDMATVQINLINGIGGDSEIFVPNTVTPNGDGLNDSFIIPSVIDHPGSELTVFNRWGNEVYFSKDYQNDWEATFNGNSLPEGTYYYCLRLNDGDKTTTRGFVTVRYE